MNISEIAPDYFNFRILWSQNTISNNGFASLDSDPYPFFFSDRISERFRYTMHNADLVSDMWYTDLIRSARKEMVEMYIYRGVCAVVEVSMENFDIDLVYCMRELKKIKTWILVDKLSNTAGEVEYGYSICFFFFFFGLKRMIRICNVKFRILPSLYDIS